MRSPFLVEAKTAMAQVFAAHERACRLQARAERRLEIARRVHAEEMAAGERLEAEAWACLLSIPGMSVASAAAITQVNKATVAKWAQLVGTAEKTGGGR